MSIKMGWYLQKRIMLVHLPPKYTKEDILKADQEILDILDTTEASLIHFIFDNTQVEEDPGIGAWLKAQSPHHPKFGWVVDIGIPSPALQFVFTMVTQIFKLRYRQFGTFEEGLKHLYRVDVTLPQPARA